MRVSRGARELRQDGRRGRKRTLSLSLTKKLPSSSTTTSSPVLTHPSTNVSAVLSTPHTSKSVSPFTATNPPRTHESQSAKRKQKEEEEEEEEEREPLTPPDHHSTPARRTAS